MRLGIDAREIQGGVYTGIGRVLAQFLRHFSERIHNDTCVLFSSVPLRDEYGSGIENRVIAESDAFWWDQVLLPASIVQEEVEIFWSPYYKIPLRVSCKKIATVLDVMYLKHEAYVQQMPIQKKLYYKLIGPRYMQAADAIFTSSDFSRKDIMTIYDVPYKKIVVIPLGVSHAFIPVEDSLALAQYKSETGISGRYLLYVGNFKPHKNIPVLLKAFKLLADEMPDLSLVLVAPKTTDYDQLVSLAARLRISGRVIFMGAIADESRLRFLYAGAEAFVFPSLYEGFGIPPVEAMACGTPVVAANATCLPDTVQGAGVLVSAQDPAAYANALRHIMSDAVFKSVLRSKGLDRVVSLREDRIAGRFHEALRQVAGYG